MQKKQKQTYVVAVAAVVVVAVLLLNGGLLGNLSVIGGFQGQAYAANGVSFGFQNSLTPIGNSFPAVLDDESICSQYLAGSVLASDLGYSCSWQWRDTSITTPEILGNVQTHGASAQVDVSYQTAQPVAECSAGNLITPSGVSPCPTISAYVQASNGTKIHEYGWIVDYSLSTAVSVSSASSTSCTGTPFYCYLEFEGVTWINQLASFYWPNTYADPTNSSWQGGVFQAALQLVVSQCVTGSTGAAGVAAQDCSASNPPGNNQLNPMNAGTQIQLYTNPQITGSWQDLGCSIAGESAASCASSVQSIINENGIVSPSQYFHEGVSYFPITMQGFGTYNCGGTLGSLCYPFVDLHMTLYTILMGSFVGNSTTHITTTQSNNGGGSNACGTGNVGLLGLCLGTSGVGLETLIVILMVGVIGYAYVTRKKTGTSS